MGRSHDNQLLAILVIAGCGSHESPTSPVGSDDQGSAAPAESPHKRELLALFDFEERKRAETDFATLPSSEHVLGPDPYRIAPVGKRHVGLLRGASAVVLLDEGIEVARVVAPRSPTSLAVSGDDIFVVGEGSRRIEHYKVTGDKLVNVGSVIELGSYGNRAIALAPDGKSLYVAEEIHGRVTELSIERQRDGKFRKTGEHLVEQCHGPSQLATAPGYLAINCMLDHTIDIVRDTSPREPAKIHHDGPLWSMALRPAADGGLLIAAVGVENHPLVREDGGFGYIDSYLYLYKLGGAQPTKLVELNISELGVVMPKWIALRETAGAIAVTTAGYATPKLLTVTYHDDFAAPEITSAEISPGTADAVLDDAGGVIIANSLLDAWVVRRGSTSTTVRVATEEPSAPTIRTVESRIGELLFFTSMMAPWNSSKDQLSRFTCETCHHEGYGDGRVHFTGRGDVHATTRPLLGLFNNRPYFSRALDESMTQMVHSEFKVANRHNGRDPWFELTRADLPWLGQVEGLPDKLTPELLRRSLIAFLADFTHRENPQANDHAKLTPIEAKGATVFRDRCASCHAPRLIAEEAKTAVPFEGWEKLVLSSSGGIVWNNAEYAKTGVLPYVHDKGTRIPSLRRLYKKWPYFTNGSAKSLDEVLDRFASGPSASYHDGSPSSATKLSADDRPALLAFLALL